MKQDRRSAKLSPKQKKKLIITSAVIAVAAVSAVVILRKTVSDKYGRNNEAEILSAEVSRGSISTSVYGSGLLSDDGVEELEIPSGVELEKIQVSAGDRISPGDLLATVNLNSVMLAMSDTGDELDELDAQISSAAGESVSSYISSAVSGRVKKIYAAAGDSVADLMYENGALMLVSLDGYMAVDIDSGKLAAGDSVTVTAPDGTEYPGDVSAVSAGTATVLITDNGPCCGDTVRVSDSGGNILGSGELYIHDQLRIVGYAGTVSYLCVSEGSVIYSGSTLLALTDTGYTADYETLLATRAVKEDELQKLVKIYKEGAVYSDIGGTVKEINAVDNDSRSGDSDDAGEQYFSISPDSTMSVSISVDESEILSVSVGQSAVVTVDSISGMTFDGTVTEIDRAGTSSSGVTTYTATVSIGKRDGMLAGMSASATIVIDGVTDALLIPVDALNKTGSGYYVCTSYDETAGELGGMTEVTVGISNSNYVEITGGLSEGDTVYYEEKQSSGGFTPGRGDFSGGMPGRDFGGGAPGGNMPGGDFGGGTPGGAPGGR
ncbi:MAG: efflux RND transporter periplasmic adaptor subunit [Clostridiales bacterium]|nr:efflux RND transporter periplasmic adaptor subunit [Clostridiales bacterium]